MTVMVMMFFYRVPLGPVDEPCAEWRWNGHSRGVVMGFKALRERSWSNLDR